MLTGWSTLISLKDQLYSSATFTVGKSYRINILESRPVSFQCLQITSSVPTFLLPLFSQNTSCSDTDKRRDNNLWEKCCLTKTKYVSWLISTLPQRESFEISEALRWLSKETQGELHEPQSAWFCVYLFVHFFSLKCTWASKTTKPNTEVKTLLKCSCWCNVKEKYFMQYPLPLFRKWTAAYEATP